MSAPVLLKTCYACENEKPFSDFPKNKRKRDGYEHTCKDCTNARIRAAYAKDPAKKIAKTRQYHLEHPEWSKRKRAESHQAHATERYARYCERGNDPEEKNRRRAATRRSESRRRAIKRGALSDKVTQEQLDDLLASFLNECWICHIDLSGEPLHWDHYQPLAAGGTHTLDNLRPACAPCNIRKNSIWPLTEERLDVIRRAVGVLRGAKVVIA